MAVSTYTYDTLPTVEQEALPDEGDLAALCLVEPAGGDGDAPA